MPHKGKKKWTRKRPKIGGWYRHCKAGVLRLYYLKPMGFTNPLLPDALLMVQDSPDSNSGKNLIGEMNTEFQDCKWFGPLASNKPEIEMYDSCRI